MAVYRRISDRDTMKVKAKVKRMDYRISMLRDTGLLEDENGELK